MDLDEAREKVARIFCPHRLELLGGTRLNAVQNVARLDKVLLSYLSYGGAVRITPGYLDTFYLVQMPLAGGAEVTAGARTITSTPSRASVLCPDDAIDMRWSAGNPQMIVYLERKALEAHLEALLGHPLQAPLRLKLGMDLGTPSARSWQRLITVLREEFERRGTLVSEPLAAAPFEELLMTSFLLAHPSNYSHLLHSDVRPPAPRTLRTVLDHIHANLARPLTTAELARTANVSVRMLQLDFHRHLGLTPSAYIRHLRLERVHADLLAADLAVGDSVTEIALRWGFTHLGRFSAQYREMYGVTPSTTLRS